MTGDDLGAGDRFDERGNVHVTRVPLTGVPHVDRDLKILHVMSQPTPPRAIYHLRGTLGRPQPSRLTSMPVGKQTDRNVRSAWSARCAVRRKPLYSLDVPKMTASRPVINGAANEVPMTSQMGPSPRSITMPTPGPTTLRPAP